jgi:ribosome biogenesis protein NSA1
VLSTLSSGKINLSSPSSSSSTSIPSPLTCLQTLSPDASQFVAAGKEVDVSIWDMEKVFSRSSVETSGAKESAGKRKKGELEAGEVWRARNVSRYVPCQIYSPVLTFVLLC